MRPCGAWERRQSADAISFASQPIATIFSNGNYGALEASCLSP